MRNRKFLTKRRKKQLITGLIAFVAIAFGAYTQSNEGNGSFLDNLANELGVENIFQKEPESIKGIKSKP